MNTSLTDKQTLWLGLALSPQAQRQTEYLLQNQQSIEQFWQQSSHPWPGERLRQQQAWLDAHPEITVACPDDAHYPERLRCIQRPPAFLWIKGHRDALLKPGIALVGSRKAHPQSEAWALQTAACLGAYPISTISGFALGIDIAAHLGSAYAQSSTVGVLGCGINHPYPRANQRHLPRILENGCLVTEFAPNTTPKPYHFPERNRIISGLSLAIVVVEAGLKSGTLSTARHAADQGREVLVAKHTNLPLAPGNALLMDEGATPVDSAPSIASALPAYNTHHWPHILQTQLLEKPWWSTKELQGLWGDQGLSRLAELRRTGQLIAFHQGWVALPDLTSAQK